MPLTPEQAEAKAQRKLKARDAAVRIQREFLEQPTSKAILFRKDTKGRYAALNRALYDILCENLAECGKDGNVMPLWEGKMPVRNPYRQQLLDLADARCPIRPRGEGGKKRWEEDNDENAIIISDDDEPKTKKSKLAIE